MSGGRGVGLAAKRGRNGEREPISSQKWPSSERSKPLSLFFIRVKSIFGKAAEFLNYSHPGDYGRLEQALDVFILFKIHQSPAVRNNELIFVYHARKNRGTTNFFLKMRC